ncbi:hypothetical protein SAMN05216319_5487 [Duganella sp. CF402]|uniref:hypothetical protein n=1 Tax=unclassified Duganella TaxID=2636909 RepID=UPI0008B82603|nr:MULTISPECIES: hypothetical protein [unclassified Duganella]RZT01890.1 hypothetical protein EV582_5544 [Duganella sp. BK701]SEN19678.1 hypothetical protein SAMN05216319_5487 [Duganella sp. CF402]
MKPYQIVMALALVGAAGLVLFGDNSPSSDIAEPVARAERGAGAASSPSPSPSQATVATTRVPGKDAAPGDTIILALVPRAQLVGEAGDATFASGEGVFMGQNWNPPPPPPPPPSNTPPPPPMAPPMPFTYIGKALADGAWEVFLARGDKTYSVRVQTVIDGTYRVEKIMPPLMSVTYLPLNQQQQINIGALE